MEMLVRYFSEPGDLVVDTCGGGFTTAVACRNLGRRCISCDIDEGCVIRGQDRLARKSPGLVG
jgi:site-specific DNA-methyltransferase (adenine-specific)